MLTWHTHTAHDVPQRHDDAWFWHAQKLKNILFKQVLKLFTLELKYILYFFETYFKIINFSFHSIFKTRELFFKTLSFERIIEHAWQLCIDVFILMHTGWIESGFEKTAINFDFIGLLLLFRLFATIRTLEIPTIVRREDLTFFQYSSHARYLEHWLCL